MFDWKKFREERKEYRKKLKEDVQNGLLNCACCQINQATSVKNDKAVCSPCKDKIRKDYLVKLENRIKNGQLKCKFCNDKATFLHHNTTSLCSNPQCLVKYKGLDCEKGKRDYIKTKNKKLPQINNAFCESDCCKGLNKPAFIIIHNKFACIDCRARFRKLESKAMKIKKQKNTELLKNGQLFCACKNCQNNNPQAIGLDRKGNGECQSCKSIRLNIQNIKIQQKTQTNDAFRALRKKYQEDYKKRKQEEKEIDLANSLAVVKIFTSAAGIRNTANSENFREQRARKPIFKAIKKISGLDFDNESNVNKVSRYSRDIDIEIPQLKLFIEFKNTHHTQSSHYFKEQMKKHRKALDESRMKTYTLISVSVNGSMGDYSILGFLKDFFMPRALPYMTKKATLKMNSLIYKLESNPQLFRSNAMPSLTTKNILQNMQNNSI